SHWCVVCLVVVLLFLVLFCFFFQAEDGIRDFHVTGVQTCALPISRKSRSASWATAFARSPRRSSPPSLPCPRSSLGPTSMVCTTGSSRSCRLRLPVVSTWPFCTAGTLPPASPSTSVTAASLPTRPTRLSSAPTRTPLRTCWPGTRWWLLASTTSTGSRSTRSSVRS